MKRFQLLKLPFSESSLAPFLSAKTVHLHYAGHHATYVKNLNALVAQEPDWQDFGLEELICRTQQDKTAVETDLPSTRSEIHHNASQVWNHNFYWQSLTPQKINPQSLPIFAALKNSFENFKNDFVARAEKHFGSGWIWLIQKSDKKLDWIITADTQTPLILGLKPLLVCDLWEHAYYLDYKNEKKKYFKAFFNKVNWTFANQNYTQS